MCFFPWTGVVFPGTSISSRSTRIPIVKLKQKFRLRDRVLERNLNSWNMLLLYISNMFHILNFSIICRLVDLRTRQQKSLIPPDNCQVTSRSHHGFVNTAQLQNVQIGTYGVKQKPQCVVTVPTSIFSISCIQFSPEWMSWFILCPSRPLYLPHVTLAKS